MVTVLLHTRKDLSNIMPIEPLKEMAKAASDGYAHALIDWFLGLVAATIAALGTMWKFLSGKLTKIEVDSYSLAELKKDLKEHIKDETGTFNTLFEKHDHVLERVNEIGKSVARIEGVLSRSVNGHTRKE